MLLQLNANAGNYIIDILVVVVILGVALVCAKRGFIDCLFGFIATIVAIILAFALMKPFVGWTGGIFGLQGVLEKACTGVFAKVKPFTIDISNQGISEALAGKNLPAFLIDAIVKGVGNESIPAGTTIAMLAGSALGEFITGLISWIVVFLIAKILIMLLRNTLGSVIENIPIVGGVNHILGFVVGILQGTMIVSGIIAVISILPIPSATQFFSDCLFVGLLYNHNPLNVILGWILV